MSKSEFLSMMDELLELPPGELKGNEQLADLEEWDSLALISFMAKANSSYGVILSPQEIAKCKTVNDLEELTSAH